MEPQPTAQSGLPAIPNFLSLYLYGASDDLHEISSDHPNWDFEAYGDIQVTCVEVINGVAFNTTLIAHYSYDDDWGIWLEGTIPDGWIIRAIEGNIAHSVRGKPHSGTFIHILVPRTTVLALRDLDD